jgi:hypothetical protein
LSLLGDSWKAFIARNGFEDTDPVQVDKPMVIETKPEPPVPLHLLLPKPSADPPIDLPDTVTKSAEAIKKPMRKNPKENLTANEREKECTFISEWPGTNQNPLSSLTLSS